MTDLRVGQAPVIALASVNPDLRVTQAGVLAMASVAPPLQVTQASVLVLGSVVPDMRIFQAPVIVLGSGSPCGTQWAQIWKIERTDGEIFRFTSKDTDLEYPPGSGIEYQSCDSLVPSASEAVSELDAAGSMDLSGAIGADGITEQALYSGLFDGATAEAWLVPWAGEGMPKRLLKGTFGAVEQSPTGFKVELLGDGAKLTQTPLISLLQPQCRWIFGDGFCQKDLGPLTVTGTVDSSTGQRAFVDAARAEAAGYFTRGVVTFTSGDNIGISAEIKEHGAGGSFTLWPRLTFAISAGDQYSMTPGCTNLKEASGGTNGCTDWANLLRFGGFDKVPGGDKRGKTPNLRT